MNKKIILICGCCATGKSTFSRNLSEKLNIPCFNKDTIKETMGDSLVQVPPDVFSKLSNTAFCLMKYIAESFFMSQKPFILESNFRQTELNQLETLIEFYQYECLPYLFTGDMEVLYSRFINREKTNRHWIHISSATETFETFSGGVRPLGEVKMSNATVIRVDTTYFDKVNYKELEQKAIDFL